MYLWSIDMDAVLVAMSCFSLLCQEADIRCGTEEVNVTSLLPNYHIFSEIAQASTVLTTGIVTYKYIHANCISCLLFQNILVFWFLMLSVFFWDVFLT